MARKTRERAEGERFSRGRRHLLALALLGGVGCVTTGRDFARPSHERFLLGRTTEAEVVANMGEPDRLGERLDHGQRIKVLVYVYASAGAESTGEGVTAAKGAAFYVHEDRLVGFDFTSSFAADSTYFDPTHGKAIHPGMSESEVHALLGDPDGEYRYPLVGSADAYAWPYLFTQTRGYDSQVNNLVVVFGADRRVEKVQFSGLGE